MDIEIKNEENVIYNCDTILAYNNDIESNLQTLESTLKRIKDNWESNGGDKKSYMEEMQKQVSNLTLIKNAGISLANIIKQYAESLQQTSSNTLDIVIGENVGDKNVTIGYKTASQAVSGENSYQLNHSAIDENSTYKAFAVIDSNGNVQQHIGDSGTSLNDYMANNNLSAENIAVDVGKGGASTAWVPAAELLK